MAVPVLSPSSYGRLKSQINQYRATTGRDMSPGMIQSLLEAEIKQQAGRATEEARFALSKEQAEQAQQNFETGVGLQREQMAQEKSAAKTRGLVQLGEVALTGAMMLGRTATGKAAISKAAGLIGMGQAATTTSAGVGAGGQVSAGFSPAITSEYGALETAGVSSASQGAAVGGGAAAGGSVVGGIAGGVSTAMPYYGLAKAGGAVLTSQFDDSTIAGQSGESLQSPLNVEQYWLKEAGAPGAATVVADALNPLAPLERIFSGALGTIICTELNRQGLLDTKVLKLAGLYRARYLDQQTYKGYIKWATPVVRWMKKSKLVTSIMRPIAVCWCLEMAHRLVPSRYKCSWFGKLVNLVAVPISRFIGGED